MKENKLKLIVELTFSKEKKMSKKDEQTIIQNVMDALESQANTAGIVPDDAKFTTDIIDVRNEQGNGLTFDFTTGQYI